MRLLMAERCLFLPACPLARRVPIQDVELPCTLQRSLGLLSDRFRVQRSMRPTEVPPGVPRNCIS